MVGVAPTQGAKHVRASAVVVARPLGTEAGPRWARSVMMSVLAPVITSIGSPTKRGSDRQKLAAQSSQTFRVIVNG